MTDSALRTTASRRFVWVGLVAPSALAALAAIIQISMFASLPVPAATHWGPDGSPDGFGSPWSFPILTILVVFGTIALVGIPSVVAVHRGHGRGPIQLRLCAALLWWISVLLSVGLTGAVAAQRGLTDAHEARHTWLWLLAGAVLGVVCGVIAWRLTLNPPIDEGAAYTPEPMHLEPNERVVWTSVTRMSSGATILYVSVVVGIAVLTAFVSTRSPAAMWICLSTLAVVTIAMATTYSYRIRVDQSGIDIRSGLGIPRIHRSIAQVSSTAVTQVSPLGDFGGWGFRFMFGRGIGIVQRGGPALELRFHSGAPITITMDQPEQAARVIQGLRERLPR